MIRFFHFDTWRWWVNARGCHFVLLPSIYIDVIIIFGCRVEDMAVEEMSGRGDVRVEVMIDEDMVGEEKLSWVKLR